MRKLMLCLLFGMICFSLSAQESKPPLTSEQLLKKSKSQKIAGFVLLGLGTIGIIAVSGGESSFDTVAGVTIASGAAILGSIPLFIASGRNKRKAKELSTSFRLESKQFFQPGQSKIQFMPVVALKIGL